MTAGEAPEEEGDGRRYADEVNAPLSRETLEALRAELESEEHARFRRARRDGNAGEA